MMRRTLASSPALVSAVFATLVSCTGGGNGTPLESSTQGGSGGTAAATGGAGRNGDSGSTALAGGENGSSFAGVNGGGGAAVSGGANAGTSATSSGAGGHVATGGAPVAGAPARNPAGDDDGDGLSNGDEAQLSLDPDSWDSDDDALTDLAEVGDPAQPRDSDDDGIIDALECDLTDNDRDGTSDTTDLAVGWQVASGRFFPRVIANDGQEATRVELRLTGAGVTNVALQTPGNFIDEEVLPNELVVDGAALGDQALELFDDGSHGDRVVGDNVWSRGGITTRMAIRTPTGGRGWVTFLKLMVTSGAGPEERFLGIGEGPKLQRGLGFYLGVVDAEQVVKPSMIDEAVQKTPHLMNLVAPEASVALRSKLVNTQPTDPTIPGLFKSVLDKIPGDVDFVAIFADHPARGTLAGLHLRASVSAAGTGMVPYSAGPAWGAEGDGFKAGLLLDFSLYAPLNHEIMHHWGVYLSEELGFDWGSSHWGVASTYGVLGGFDPDSFVDHADGTYSIDFFSTDGNDWRTTAFSPIELYLAGLAAASEVPPIITMQDAARVGETDTAVIVEGTPSTVTIADIIAKHGERVPSYSDAQKDFTMAFAVYSPEPLSASEMTWLDLFADFFGRESVPGTMSFRAATGGRATMTTKLPALVGE